jgi:hypothetical protein
MVIVVTWFRSVTQTRPIPMLIQLQASKKQIKEESMRNIPVNDNVNMLILFVILLHVSGLEWNLIFKSTTLNSKHICL